MSTPGMTERDIRLTDGRNLHVFAGDNEGDELVVTHHGTPGSGAMPPEWADLARQRGLRLVSYDRPGFGDSTRHQGRTVADAADDVAAIVDALGHETFFTFGSSGGGPHAIACAARLADRVRAAATFASIGPYDIDGFDWMAGMAQGNVDEFGAALAGPEQLRAFLDAERIGMLTTTGPDLAAALSGMLPPVDVAFINGAFGDAMAAQVSRALRDGTDGWFDDDIAFTLPWGFTLDGITVPLLVAQGGQDRMVPFAHGQWLAEHIAGATPMLSPTDGHVSMRSRLGEVLDWMLAAAK